MFTASVIISSQLQTYAVIGAFHIRILQNVCVWGGVCVWICVCVCLDDAYIIIIECILSLLSNQEHVGTQIK